MIDIEELREIRQAAMGIDIHLKIAEDSLERGQDIVARTNINQAMTIGNHTIRKLEALKDA